LSLLASLCSTNLVTMNITEIFNEAKAEANNTFVMKRVKGPHGRWKPQTAYHALHVSPWANDRLSFLESRYVYGELATTLIKAVGNNLSIVILSYLVWDDNPKTKRECQWAVRLVKHNAFALAVLDGCERSNDETAPLLL